MDKVEICNMALSRIGASQIERMDEDSVNARICGQFYDACRRSELRNYPWSFATRRVKLALVNTKPFDYKYAYRYPSNALYIRKLYNTERGWALKDVKHQIIGDANGRVILTDMELAGCEYTADITEASLFDSEFCSALAWAIAMEIAVPITGNVQMASYCQNSYQHFVTEARVDNTNEDNPDRKHVNELTMSRFIGIDDYDITRDYD